MGMVLGRQWFKIHSIEYVFYCCQGCGLSFHVANDNSKLGRICYSVLPLGPGIEACRLVKPAAKCS